MTDFSLQENKTFTTSADTFRLKPSPTVLNEESQLAYLWTTEPSVQSRNFSARGIQKRSVEKIISEMNGSIIKIGYDFVDVKFITDLIVKFPKKIFKDESLLNFGQPIRYQIKIGQDGYRYQAFEKIEGTLFNPEKAKILKLLEDIKPPE